MITFNQSQLQAVSCWIRTVLKPVKEDYPSQARAIEKIRRQCIDANKFSIPDIVQGLSQLYSCIRDRTWFYLDDALDAVAYGLNGKKAVEYMDVITAQVFSLTRSQIAQALAWICQETLVYWNDKDPALTSYEVQAFKKSAFGKALVKADCFASQQDRLQGTAPKQAPASTATPAANPTQAPTAAATAATNSTQSPTASTSGSAPLGGSYANRRITGNAKNPYKSLGPQSGFTRGLIGTPGNKINLNGNLYAVACKSAKNGKTLAAFCYPVQGQTKLPLAPNGGNLIMLGDPSGYTASVLYFTNMPDAQNIYDFVQVKYDNTAKWNLATQSGLNVIPVKADPNGYYEILLENGSSAYIRAKMLNEELEGDEN